MNLIHNPSDDYLGLGEDDREEPNPEDQMTAPEQGNPLAAVPVVDVHPSGTFKYILARISLNGASKNVVRASRHFDLHVDNFEALRMEIAPTGAVAAMLGGGRITHDTDSVNVYGYSATFGRCETCNSIAAKILACPTCANGVGSKSITWTNTGY